MFYAENISECLSIITVQGSVVPVENANTRDCRSAHSARVLPYSFVIALRRLVYLPQESMPYLVKRL